MNENRSNDGRTGRPGAKDAQPWHAADEKPAAKTNSAPLGTQSLTGGGPEVGLPPKAGDAAERGEDRREGIDKPQQPDPMVEPRASIGEILGRKP